MIYDYYEVPNEDEENVSLVIILMAMVISIVLLPLLIFKFIFNLKNDVLTLSAMTLTSKNTLILRRKND